MAKIVWTEPAISDLNGIAEYIALDKVSAAKRLVQKVFNRVELFSDSTNQGGNLQNWANRDTGK